LRRPLFLAGAAILVTPATSSESKSWYAYHYGYRGGYGGYGGVHYGYHYGGYGGARYGYYRRW
jgi:hypothetical protein